MFESFLKHLGFVTMANALTSKIAGKPEVAETFSDAIQKLINEYPNLSFISGVCSALKVLALTFSPMQEIIRLSHTSAAEIRLFRMNSKSASVLFETGKALFQEQGEYGTKNKKHLLDLYHKRICYF